MKYKDAIDTMCERCINHEMCEGTGCQPKKDLEELVANTDNQISTIVLFKMIDELEYNIKDGINLPGCRFRFSADTYEGAIGALTLLEQRIRKLSKEVRR